MGRRMSPAFALLAGDRGQYSRHAFWLLKTVARTLYTGATGTPAHSPTGTRAALDVGVWGGLLDNTPGDGAADGRYATRTACAVYALRAPNVPPASTLACTIFAQRLAAAAA